MAARRGQGTIRVLAVYYGPLSCHSSEYRIDPHDKIGAACEKWYIIHVHTRCWSPGSLYEFSNRAKNLVNQGNKKNVINIKIVEENVESSNRYVGVEESAIQIWNPPCSNVSASPRWLKTNLLNLVDFFEKNGKCRRPALSKHMIEIQNVSSASRGTDKWRNKQDFRENQRRATRNTKNNTSNGMIKKPSHEGLFEWLRYNVLRYFDKKEALADEGAGAQPQSNTELSSTPRNIVSPDRPQQAGTESMVVPVRISSIRYQPPNLQLEPETSRSATSQDRYNSKLHENLPKNSDSQTDTQKLDNIGYDVAQNKSIAEHGNAEQLSASAINDSTKLPERLNNINEDVKTPPTPKPLESSQGQQALSANGTTVRTTSSNETAEAAFKELLSEKNITQTPDNDNQNITEASSELQPPASQAGTSSPIKIQILPRGEQNDNSSITKVQTSFPTSSNDSVEIVTTSLQPSASRPMNDNLPNDQLPPEAFSNNQSVSTANGPLQVPELEVNAENIQNFPDVEVSPENDDQSNGAEKTSELEANTQETPAAENTPSDADFLASQAITGDTTKTRIPPPETPGDEQGFHNSSLQDSGLEADTPGRQDPKITLGGANTSSQLSASQTISGDIAKAKMPPEATSDEQSLQNTFNLIRAPSLVADTLRTQAPGITPSDANTPPQLSEGQAINGDTTKAQIAPGISSDEQGIQNTSDSMPAPGLVVDTLGTQVPEITPSDANTLAQLPTSQAINGDTTKVEIAPGISSNEQSTQNTADSMPAPGLVADTQGKQAPEITPSDVNIPSELPTSQAINGNTTKVEIALGSSSDEQSIQNTADSMPAPGLVADTQEKKAPEITPIDGNTPSQLSASQAMNGDITLAQIPRRILSDEQSIQNTSDAMPALGLNATTWDTQVSQEAVGHSYTQSQLPAIQPINADITQAQIPQGIPSDEQGIQNTYESMPSPRLEATTRATQGSQEPPIYSYTPSQLSASQAINGDITMAQLPPGIPNNEQGVRNTFDSMSSPRLEATTWETQGSQNAPSHSYIPSQLPATQPMNSDITQAQIPPGIPSGEQDIQNTYNSMPFPRLEATNWANQGFQEPPSYSYTPSQLPASQAINGDITMAQLPPGIPSNGPGIQNPYDSMPSPRLEPTNWATQGSQEPPSYSYTPSQLPSTQPINGDITMAQLPPGIPSNGQGIQNPYDSMPSPRSEPTNWANQGSQEPPSYSYTPSQLPATHPMNSYTTQAQIPPGIPSDEQSIMNTADSMPASGLDANTWDTQGSQEALGYSYTPAQLPASQAKNGDITMAQLPPGVPSNEQGIQNTYGSMQSPGLEGTTRATQGSQEPPIYSYTPSQLPATQAMKSDIAQAQITPGIPNDEHNIQNPYNSIQDPGLVADTLGTQVSEITPSVVNAPSQLSASQVINSDITLAQISPEIPGYEQNIQNTSDSMSAPGLEATTWDTQGSREALGHSYTPSQLPATQPIHGDTTKAQAAPGIPSSEQSIQNTADSMPAPGLDATTWETEGSQEAPSHSYTPSQLPATQAINGDTTKTDNLNNNQSESGKMLGPALALDAQKIQIPPEIAEYSTLKFNSSLQEPAPPGETKMSGNETSIRNLTSPLLVPAEQPPANEPKQNASQTTKSECAYQLIIQYPTSSESTYQPCIDNLSQASSALETKWWVKMIVGDVFGVFLLTNSDLESMPINQLADCTKQNIELLLNDIVRTKSPHCGPAAPKQLLLPE